MGGRLSRFLWWWWRAATNAQTLQGGYCCGVGFFPATCSAELSGVFCRLAF